MKIFISGPMTGYDHFNAPAFNEAERILRKNGYDVFNPAWMRFGGEWEHDEILAIDIRALKFCDGIVQLPGWERSDGAMAEHKYASLEKKLYFRIVGEEVWQTCKMDRLKN